MRTYDPAAIATDQLLRSFCFHTNDRDTTTLEQECCRIHLLDVIGAELRKRGIDPLLARNGRQR